MATQKANITKTIVDKLKAGDTVWDTMLSGFGVRCQKKAKVYILKKFYNGKQHWFTIGKYSEGVTVTTARKKAGSILGQIADGKDPAQIREEKRTGPQSKNYANAFFLTTQRSIRNPPA